MANSSIDYGFLDEFDEKIEWNSVNRLRTLLGKEINENLLTLSCVNHRLTPVPILGSKIQFLYENVTDDDRIKSQLIKDYYSKKIMLWSITGLHLSKFRSDLSTFIHNEVLGPNINEFIGLAYKLPVFYEYDKKIDNIFFSKNTKIKNMRTTSLVEKESKLTFIDSTILSRKHTKNKEYWFSDIHDNVVMAEFMVSNPLIHIWEQIIHQPSFSLKGNFSFRKKDNREYFTVHNYKMG